MNPQIDKFFRIEQILTQDLDNWLCNLYFEIEKVNLMDIKSDQDNLYFSPAYKKALRKERIEAEKRKTLTQATLFKRGTKLFGAGKRKNTTVFDSTVSNRDPPEDEDERSDRTSDVDDDDSRDEQVPFVEDQGGVDDGEDSFKTSSCASEFDKLDDGELMDQPGGGQPHTHRTSD